MFRAQKNQCLFCGGQARWEAARIFSGRVGGGVDQGGSSGDGEDRLGLKFLGRREEKGGPQGESQVFGLSNWIVGDAVDWAGD